MAESALDQKQTDAPKTAMPIRKSDNIIAVASGKGGVGKTWFSITLSHALAQAGQRVLLFDGDLGLANVDVQLGVMPRRDLSDVIRGKLGIDKVIQHYEEGGFDLVAGRSGQASLSALPSQRLVLLRDQLSEISERYDAVILDLGAGVDRTVRFLSASSGQTILVTGDEPTALTDAYSFIKMGARAGVNNKISVVINQAENAGDAEKSYNILLKTCENFLRVKPPMLGFVRRDTNVKKSIRRQTPILNHAPDSDAAMDVSKIARAVIRDLADSKKSEASA